MAVHPAAPRVIDPEESTLHSPVVGLELLQGIGRRRKEQIHRSFVVQRKEGAGLIRHGEHGVEMRAIREAFTNLFRPLRLAGSEAIGAMPIPTGTRIPLQVVALIAFGGIKPQFTVAAVGDVIKSGILLITQTTGPEVTPFPQNVIDGCFDCAIMNIMLKKATINLNKPGALSSAFKFQRNFSSNSIYSYDLPR